MRRFYSQGIDGQASSVEITGDEFVHLKKVLRSQPGDRVSVFNGLGLELTGVIESIGRDSASVKVESRSHEQRESGRRITLFQGMLKGDKPEFIIQKATELGLYAVAFFLTPRAVPLFKPEKSKDKLLRWNKVAVEAAKQCGRSVLPRVEFIPEFEGVFKAGEEGFRLIFWEGGGSNLKETMRQAPPSKGVSALIGPEGGLTAYEVSLAEAAGFKKVSLGPRVLRAETAAIAAVSVIQYELGDLN